MGALKALLGKRLYLDANLFIYALRRRCDTVLTNDPDFRAIPGLHTSLLADLD